jgi:hypothetical protein
MYRLNKSFSTYRIYDIISSKDEVSFYKILSLKKNIFFNSFIKDVLFVCTNDLNPIIIDSIESNIIGFCYYRSCLNPSKLHAINSSSLFYKNNNLILIAYNLKLMQSLIIFINFINVRLMQNIKYIINYYNIIFNIIKHKLNIIKKT